jgi:dTDP-4-amino-4,6-dideoxygalactose transaminase
VLRCQRRDELAEFLKQRKIGAGVYYPLPLHLQQCFAGLGHRAGDFPQAEAAAREVLALPIYPELTEPQQVAVVESLRAFYLR